MKQTPQERIKADAEAAAKIVEQRIKSRNIEYGRMVSQVHGYTSGYITGATAENERAQVLVDALEIAKKHIHELCMTIIRLGYTPFNPISEINEAIEQWKSGKEVGREKWVKATATWNSYPAGTKAKALNGGHWIKIPCGRWQWPGGCSFPTPGGDATGEVCIPE